MDDYTEAIADRLKRQETESTERRERDEATRFNRDESMERLLELREKDPAAVERMGASGQAAFYAHYRQAAAKYAPEKLKPPTGDAA